MIPDTYGPGDMQPWSAIYGRVQEPRKWRVTLAVDGQEITIEVSALDREEAETEARAALEHAAVKEIE